MLWANSADDVLSIWLLLVYWLIKHAGRGSALTSKSKTMHIQRGMQVFILTMFKWLWFSKGLLKKRGVQHREIRQFWWFKNREVWFIFFFSKGRDRTYQWKGQKPAKRSSGLDWGQFVGLEGWWYVLELEIAVGFQLFSGECVVWFAWNSPGGKQWLFKEVSRVFWKKERRDCPEGVYTVKTTRCCFTCLNRS